MPIVRIDKHHFAVIYQGSPVSLAVVAEVILLREWNATHATNFGNVLVKFEQ